MNLTTCWPDRRLGPRTSVVEPSTRPPWHAVRLGLAWLAVALLAGCMDSYHESILKADLNLLKQVCQQYDAGDKIYRTVEGVEGFYHMKSRVPYPNWADQYGMAEPWGQAYFGRGDNPGFFGDGSGGNSDSYWFYEQPPPLGSSAGAIYRRTILIKSDQKPTEDELKDGRRYLDAEGYVPHVEHIRVNALLSRYGLLIDDLTTSELRKHWISGARLRIVELPSQDVLAERVHFYRATGPSVKMAWAPGVGCDNPISGYEISKFKAPNVRKFVRSVLGPPAARPTTSQLESLWNGYVK